MYACRERDGICIPKSSFPRVLIIGGGFAGISVAKTLRNQPVQVVLLDKNNFHQFQPLLYQVATSGLGAGNIVFPLRKQFSGYKNFCYRMAAVETIQPINNIVLTDIGAIEYDCLVIAAGSTSNFFELKDIKANSLGMKTIQEALNIRSFILQNLEKAVVSCDETDRDTLTNFVVVGGGPAGVETAGALAEFRKYILPKDYPELDKATISVYLLEAGDRLLSTMSPKSSKLAYSYLTKMGVQVRLNTIVQSYDGQSISTDNGEILSAKTLIWTAGVHGCQLNGISEEAIDNGKRILVDEYFKVKGASNIYAIGDIAAMTSESYPNGHPMVAQVAIQQGQRLGKNLLLQLEKEEPVKFSYRDKGALATIGKHKAVADIGNLSFGGRFAWLLWSVVHLFSISGFRNKLMVGLSWAWNYLTYDRGNRLIIRKFKSNKGQEYEQD